jgi:hypothetical protein
VEVDCIIDLGNNEVLALEIKAGEPKQEGELFTCDTNCNSKVFIKSKIFYFFTNLKYEAWPSYGRNFKSVMLSLCSKNYPSLREDQNL